MTSRRQPGVRIREALPVDAESIAALLKAAFLEFEPLYTPGGFRATTPATDEIGRRFAEGPIWVAEQDGRVQGVMGVQDKGDVALVRHAYVATTAQRSGVGTKLLRHLETLTDKPILIGTWPAASWAIEFYQRNGYTVVSSVDKERLLRTYWSIPARQVETSVVLADRRWPEVQKIISTDR